MSEEERVRVNEHDISDLKLELAKLNVKQEHLIKELNKFSSGINRALFLIGGGFVSYLVWFFTRGGGQ